MKYCPECGAKIEEIRNYCPECGFKFSTQTKLEDTALTIEKPIETIPVTKQSDKKTVTKKQEKKHSKTPKQKIALAILIIVIIIIISAWYLGSKQNPNTLTPDPYTRPLGWYYVYYYPFSSLGDRNIMREIGMNRNNLFYFNVDSSAKKWKIEIKKVNNENINVTLLFNNIVFDTISSNENFIQKEYDPETSNYPYVNGYDEPVSLINSGGTIVVTITQYTDFSGWRLHPITPPTPVSVYE